MSWYADVYKERCYYCGGTMRHGQCGCQDIRNYPTVDKVAQARDIFDTVVFRLLPGQKKTQKCYRCNEMIEPSLWEILCYDCAQDMAS